MKKKKKEWFSRCHRWQWRLRRDLLIATYFLLALEKSPSGPVIILTWRIKESTKAWSASQIISSIYFRNPPKAILWITLGDSGRAGDSKTIFQIPNIKTLFNSGNIYSVSDCIDLQVVPPWPYLRDSFLWKWSQWETLQFWEELPVYCLPNLDFFFYILI